jgi:hypothetical protein
VPLPGSMLLARSSTVALAFQTYRSWVLHFDYAGYGWFKWTLTKLGRGTLFGMTRRHKSFSMPQFLCKWRTEPAPCFGWIGSSCNTLGAAKAQDVTVGNQSFWLVILGLVLFVKI